LEQEQQWLLSEVSRGHSKPETSLEKKREEVSQKEEGPNVRMVKQSESLWCRQ
jgi:hypothetical protein